MYPLPPIDPEVSSNLQLPSYQPEKLCHILLGDFAAVTNAINRMERLGYRDRLAWLRPIPTGRNGEYISVMSRRVAPPES